MEILILPSFSEIRDRLRRTIVQAPLVHTEKWQGMDVSKNPAAATYELRNVVVSTSLSGIEDLEHWRGDIQPNLPWADDHFLERVGGEPLNPGVQWANWPWGKSANRFRDAGERFNHTYMERLWPKWARWTEDGSLPTHDTTWLRHSPGRTGQGDEHRGIGRGPIGDLQDLVELLAREPYTRQAWIPLFFPEDTGIADGGRKPCTLGYQILVRDTPLGPEANIYYPLRSCDLIRHWADDCYLAVRLLLWIMDRCREKNVFWEGVKPGDYTMHMTSLHIFINDKKDLMR